MSTPFGTTRRTHGVQRRVAGETATVVRVPLSDLAVMGLAEVLPRLRHLRCRLAEVGADLARRQPSLVVTIDSPGFTLRVLRPLAALRKRLDLDGEGRGLGEAVEGVYSGGECSYFVWG